MTNTAKLWEYAVLWHPTEKQKKDEDKKSMVIVERKTVIAEQQGTVSMMATMDIPAEYKTSLDQCEILMRPF